MLSTNDSLKELAKKYASNHLNIINISSLCKRPGLEHDSYFTNNSAFIFPISGCCHISFDNMVFYAEPGKLIHGCPQKHIEFHIIGDEPFHHINIYHDSKEELLFQLDLGQNKDVIHNNLQQIIRLEEKTDIKSTLSREHLIFTIFETLFADYMNHTIQDNYDLVCHVIDYIHNNYNKKLTLRKISEYAGKSPNQISYLFHHYVGKRPIDYLIAYRLKQAVKMLNYDDSLTIQDVAHGVGYVDSLYFSRLFKKHIGCSPNNFRRTYPFADLNLLSSQSIADWNRCKR